MSAITRRFPFRMESGRSPMIGSAAFNSGSQGTRTFNTGPRRLAAPARFEDDRPFANFAPPVTTACSQ